MSKAARLFVAAALTAGLSLNVVGAMAQSNPIDRVSNPDGIDYIDVEVSPQEMAPPFVRQGLILEPQRLTSIRLGSGADEVEALLGEPLRKSGWLSRQWEYDVRFRMPRSENYLVCQYKVLFDGQQSVKETVWRRRQCEQLARGELGA